MPQKSPANVRNPFRVNLTASELSQLLTQAKSAHSALPADYPAHNWEDWYAEWIVERLNGHPLSGHARSILSPKLQRRIAAEYDEAMHNDESGRMHVHLIYFVLALAAILFSLFF